MQLKQFNGFFENPQTPVICLRSLFIENISSAIAGIVFVFAMAFVGTFVDQPSVFADEDVRIIAVDVRGNKTIAKETILARVQTKPGFKYDDHIVSEDIRRLFALGYFTDVKADVETMTDGLKLIFVVTEKPSIGSINISGNRYIKTSKVSALLGVSEGELHDARSVKKGIDSIKAEYARKGYSDVEIVYRAEEDFASNTTNLYLLIDEGPRMRISEVLIEGNFAYSDKKIRKLLKTKSRKWWLFRAGIYNEQEAEIDLERIKAFYRKYGYQDIQVEYETLRSPDGKGMLAHFKITEGLQHRVGRVDIEGVVLFPEREMKEIISLKPGAVYSVDKLQDDMAIIKQYYGDRGYIHSEVKTDPQLDSINKRVNITYTIQENELVYINRIDLRGNIRTKDVVIRRELRAHPGEPFDGKNIRTSIDRLYNLGFFEEVTVDTLPTDDPEREDLIVEIKEARTGSFSFGGGFSSVDRLVGMIELEQRNFDFMNYPNFTGAGQDFKIRVELGTVRRNFDISFTEPWIFGHDLSFGIDAFNRTRLRSRNVGLSFEEERRGGGFRFGKEFFDALRVDVGYKLFRTEISDVVAEASADLKAEQGRSDISLVNISVSYDQRDSRFDPTDGYYTFASTEVAGGFFAGDREFYRMQAGGSSYWPHGDRLVFEARIRAGIVDAYSSSLEVPIFERFFGGGSGTIRGYRERNVGPRDLDSNDPIGGEALLVGTLEEVVTLFSDERGRPILRGSVFFDTGDVWRRVNEFGDSFKSGIGVGARVKTPIGPIRVDIGYPLNQINEEKRKARFHFNVSRSF